MRCRRVWSLKPEVLNSYLQRKLLHDKTAGSELTLSTHSTWPKMKEGKNVVKQSSELSLKAISCFAATRITNPSKLKCSPFLSKTPKCYNSASFDIIRWVWKFPKEHLNSTLSCVKTATAKEAAIRIDAKIKAKLLLLAFLPFALGLLITAYLHKRQEPPSLRILLLRKKEVLALETAHVFAKAQIASNETTWAFLLRVLG